jgi:hypothetical protein
MSFEQNVQNQAFSGGREKTAIDKLLAEKEVQRLAELSKKTSLDRSDILEILYLLAGQESKLVNYSTWERYVILKFYVWVREFVKVCELLYDFQDDLKYNEKFCVNCKKLHYDLKTKIEIKACDNFKAKIVLNQNTLKLLNNIERQIEHNVKFMFDLYLNIARTTLSIGATGLLELLKNKFEMEYKGNNPFNANNQQPQGGLLK